DRIAVRGRPALPRSGLVEKLAWPLANLGEVRHHLVTRSFAHAPCFLVPAVEGHHDVVLLTTAQRVMDEMAIRSDPDRGGIPAQVRRHVGLRNQRTIDNMSRYAVPVADQALPDDRVHAVAANHRRAVVDAP